jgi:hypothetical protein
MIMEGAFRSMRVPMHCADSAPIRNAGIESPLAVLFRCLFFFCAPMVPAGDAARGERERHGPTAFKNHDPRNLCTCCHQRHAPPDSQRPHGRTEAIIMVAVPGYLFVEGGTMTPDCMSSRELCGFCRNLDHLGLATSSNSSVGLHRAPGDANSFRTVLTGRRKKIFFSCAARWNGVDESAPG